jgi:CheY-like chemotaxis protein
MGTATSDIPPIVLIVGTDDSASQYGAVLSSHGYWVANAASEPEALECAHDLQPDAVIVDIWPGGARDGLDVIRTIHGLAQLRRVPILVVTELQPRELPIFAHVPVAGLLLKPFAAETLIATVAGILDVSRRTYFDASRMRPTAAR